MTYYSPIITRTYVDPNLYATLKLKDGTEAWIVRDECPETPDMIGDIFAGCSLYVTRSGYPTVLDKLDEALDNMVDNVRWRLRKTRADWALPTYADILSRYYRLTNQNVKAYEFDCQGYSAGDWCDGVVLVDIDRMTRVLGECDVDTIAAEYIAHWRAYLNGDVYRIECDDDCHDLQGLISYADSPENDETIQHYVEEVTLNW